MASSSTTTSPAALHRAELAVREHFSTAGQQRETVTAGMWLFLATEVMFFGGLFMAYTVYRYLNPDAFDHASMEMSILLGAINTAVLISSSFTMALSIHSAQEGRWKALSWFLIATLMLGFVFLGIKFIEYYQHYQDHQVPGPLFQTSYPNARPFEMFFVFYFVMTGLHAVHMIVGVGVLTVLIVRSRLEAFGAEYHNPVVLAGLYWHFVDIVWVFLFAIFYLPGLHK